MESQTERSLIVNLRSIAEDLHEIKAALNLVLKPAVIFEVDNSPESKSILDKMTRDVRPGGIVRMTKEEMDYLARHPLQQFYPKFEQRK